MKLSETRRSEAYNSISDPIMDLRVTMSREARDATDEELFQLQHEIWKRLHAALNLEGTP